MDLLANYELIVGVVAAIGGVFLLGKKKANSLVITVLHEVIDEVGENVKENQEKYAELVYAKIPAKFKPFVTKKVIAKIITELVEYLEKQESVLDKK